MAVALTYSIKVSAQNSELTPLGRYSGTPTINYADQPACTLVYANERSLSGTESLDLQGGLDSAYGDPLTFTMVKTLTIENLSTTHRLIVGGGSNPVTGSDQQTIGPGKCWAVNTEYPVSGSARYLRVQTQAVGSSSSSSSSSGSPTTPAYSVMIGGT